ncbi:MAG: hypothetical protein AB1779_01810 [Candidatus Thermoplasmatota archaeon]
MRNKDENILGLGRRERKRLSLEDIELEIEPTVGKRSKEIEVNVSVLPLLPTGVYHLLDKLVPLATYKIKNSLSYKRKIKVESEVMNYTNRQIDTLLLNANEEKVLYHTPVFKPDMLKTLTTQRKGSFYYIISDIEMGKVIEEKTLELTLLSKRDLIWSLVKDFDFAVSSCAWVTPHAKEIEELIRVAADYSYSFSGKSAMGDYTKVPEELIRQLKATYIALKERYKVKYISTTLSFSPGAAQRVRLPYEVINEGSGNCIETTVTIASVAEAIGMQPYIVLVVGHAFLGLQISDNEKLYIETTMIPTNTFEEAVQRGCTNYAKHKNDGTLLMEIDVREARKLGITPMEY